MKAKSSARTASKQTTRKKGSKTLFAMVLVLGLLIIGVSIYFLSQGINLIPWEPGGSNGIEGVNLNRSDMTF